MLTWDSVRVSLERGSVFAGYVVERVLGTGGMGSVYLATHPRLPRQEALKLLRPELCADPVFVARFHREAATVARLAHPHILPVHDRGSENGQLWISMPFVEGRDAEAAVKSYPQGMPAARAVQIIGQVGSALDYAHRQQLLHRDVKPANILLAAGPELDGPEWAYLTDFGIAKAADEAVGLTATGGVMATFAYASPEQIEGRHLDNRSDIYSLGSVLYTMLTGSTPYPGSIAAALNGHLNVPPPRPTARIPGLPAGFDEVVATAMAKDPNRRYQSCRDFLTAATAALADRPVPAAGASTTARLSSSDSPGVDRPALGYPGPAPVRPGPNGTMFAPAASEYPTEPHPVVPAAKRSTRRRWVLVSAAIVVIALIAGGVLLVRSFLLPPAGPTPAAAVLAWGGGSYGQLGNGDSVNSPIPVQVSGLTGVTAVAGGDFTGYALLADGTVRSWGGGTNGQLGNGATTSSLVPVQVSGLTDVTAIAGGTYAGYALIEDGTVMAWGDGSSGQLGIGTTADSPIPVQVTGLTDVTAIAGGNYSAYALLSDGTVMAWGDGIEGQLGNGSTAGSLTPVPVTGLSGVTAIAASYSGAYALLSDGTVRAWGDGGSGQLGNGASDDSPVPVSVAGLTGVTALAAGDTTAYALLGDGTMRAWGAGLSGQLGNGSTDGSPIPVQVSGLVGVRSIASGDGVGYALLADGTVRAWGEGIDGQLGDGADKDSPVPVQVSGLTGVLAIAGAYNTGYATR